MKHLFIILFFMLVHWGFSQEKYKDIVFPVKGAPIKYCRIIEIRSPNLVVFLINQDTISEKANAYIKNEEYFDLSMIKTYAHHNSVNLNTSDSLMNLSYKDHSYFYYEGLYQKSKKLKKAGIVLSSIGAGIGALGTGLLLYSNNNSDYDHDYTFTMGFPGVFLIAGGIGCLTAGLVNLGISSSLEYRGKNGMKQCRPKKTISLQFGIQDNGIGARIKF